MNTTPPPLFPVETSPLLDESIKEHIKTLTAPLFSKVLNETSKNPLLGGVGGVRKPRVMFIHPHNYRRYFDFDKETFKFFNEEKPILGNKGSGLLFPVEYKYINNGSEFFIRFENFEVRIKKVQIEILNLLEHEKVFSIDLNNNVDELRKKVFDMEKEKFRQCLGFLRAFIGKYGGSSKFKILGSKGKLAEIKHFDRRMGEILPLKQRWHDEVGKKDYNEKVFEYSDSFYSSNTIRNLAILDIAPAIAKELEDIKSRLPRSSGEALLPLASPPLLLEPKAGAGWVEWKEYFFLNRERLGLDYSRVRGV